MKLILVIKNENELTLQLKEGVRVIDEESLTISQNLDNMLIRAIDNIAVRNTIERISLKTLKIQGKSRPEATSSMIIKAVRSGLEA